ncbi:MAG: Mandelate racemase/muconate lactonizing protein [Frankiales bacterium]|nr:Mandelate racemase/muconate lactonizing protein [Frankiales bacterium]
MPDATTDADPQLDSARVDDTAGLDALTAPPWSSRDELRITGVRSIVTAPEGIPLVVVRVDTNVDGLYGLGCATFTQRFHAVVGAIDKHIAPLVAGRHPADIEDITRMVHLSSYWRDGPVLNNALSGLDMALWDIAGKRAGMPVYELLGGRVRTAVPTYTHAGGRDIAETLESAQSFVEAGWRHIRLQAGQRGSGTYGAPKATGSYPNRPHPGGWDVEDYLRSVPALFDAGRTTLGPDVELLHDVHSRLSPKEAVRLLRSLEPYGLFFVEDVVPPDLYDRLPEIRTSSSTPLAVGEQLSSMPAAVRMVRELGVDFLRVHVSAIGGLTPARKLTALCELLGVRTAWHAPGDVSPVGAAANVALDVSTHAFGIQECHVYGEAVHEVFSGTPVVVRGYLTPSDAPGWGVDIDERAAKRFPPSRFAFERWTVGVRGTDGALYAP